MRRLCALLLAFALPGLAQALDYRLEPRQIARDTWVLEGSTDNFSQENGGNIVNIGFIVTDAGVVLIDTGPSRAYGEALREPPRTLQAYLAQPQIQVSSRRDGLSPVDLHLGLKSLRRNIAVSTQSTLAAKLIADRQPFGLIRHCLPFLGCGGHEANRQLNSA